MSESKEKLERLRARRRGHRGVCTKLEKQAIELIDKPENDNFERCKVIARQLEAKLNLLNEIDDEILNICEVDDIQREIEESAEISDRLLETVRIIDKKTKVIEGKTHNTNTNVSTPSINLDQPTEVENIESNVENVQNPTNSNLDNGENAAVNNDESNNITNNLNLSNSEQNASISNSNVHLASSLPKLPKLQLSKFSGKVTEWNSFWDSYDAAIHSNPNISKVNKFNYLQSLLEGSASRAIKGLTLTNANYDSAIKILQERFGKTQQTIAAHMDEILKIQTCNNGRTSQLRYVYDKISVHVRGLASLGISSEQYGSMLIPIIMSKIPNDMRLVIARKNTAEVWNINHLLDTIKVEIEAREVSEGVQSSSQPTKKPSVHPTVGAFVTKGGSTFQIRCVYCEEPHYSASCERVVESEARKLILRESKRCFNCLRVGHNANACRNEKRCRYCDGKHHQSICSKEKSIVKNEQNRNKLKNETKQDGESKSEFCGATTLSRTGKGSVLLQTGRAYAVNGSTSIPVRILFDTGSQRSYVTNNVARKLKLTPIKREILNLNTFGNSKSKRQSCELFKFNIRSQKGSENIELRAINFPTICAPVNSEVRVENYPHLKDLDLADFDPNSNGDKNIDILVGADFYWQIVTGEVIQAEDCPTAISSKLGWLLSGPCVKSSDDDHTVNNLILAGECIDNSTIQTDRDDEVVNVLKRFWETENIGIKSIECEKPSEEEEFLKNIRFTGKRYEVGLPWKDELPTIDDDYDLCNNRLRLLHRKLQKQPDIMAEYNKTIEEQLAAGIVEKVPECEENENKETNVHYLPHHGVIRKDKTTTKLRVVYDGSATTATREHSLNDYLFTGPNFIPQIFDILVKFRKNRIGLVSDIEKAFLMVGICEKDRDMLRFLWLKNIESENPEIVKLRFCRLVFGLRPSPAILGGVINRHLSTYEGSKAETAECLRDSLYVDDFVSGADEDDKALKLYSESKEIMNEGGFHLRKWHSNSQVLMKSIDSVEKNTVTSTNDSNVREDDQSFAKSSIARECEVQKETQVKVLGSIWDTITDMLLFNFIDLIKYAKSLPSTKRAPLKWSAKIFDPLGLLSPFTIKLKMFFQQLCLAKTNWDEKLDERNQREWDILLLELTRLNTVSVPRCYFAITMKPISIQIHGFSDASRKAYAAVTYLRTVYENGQIDVNLIASKAKVAPTKTQTIPRLELLGATILARLVHSIFNTLSLGVDVFYWVDSTAVLCWIRNERLWRQYVQNRINEIRRLSSSERWHFCPGSLNPADLPSRGIADKLHDNESIWFKGPEFLLQSEDQWPNDPVGESKVAYDEAVKTPSDVVRSLTVNSESTKIVINAIIDINLFSSYKKLLRVTAYVMRFIRALRKEDVSKPTGTLNQKFLLATEIEHAEMMWIRSIQSSSFAKEIEYLQRRPKSSPPQYVRQFGLYLDKNEILRCKGRIGNSSMDLEGKHPILLPSKHRFVELLIRDIHEKVKHNGIRDTLTTARERYWILRGRELVKRLIRRCVVCRKAEGKPYAEGKPPDLPASRVSDDPPFANVGLDFAGPLLIRDKPGHDDESTNKVYILLFTCASTRAVHLEVTPALTVQSFLCAFRRFTSRRGIPGLLLSDNAKTFRAASREIRKLYRSEEVSRYFADMKISWNFIVEKAPWWGGFWERLVKSIKRPLKKVIGRTSLTYDQLQTLVVEIEGLLNARPLTYIYDDSESISFPLTPSHLIYGRRVVSSPNGQYFEVTSTNKSLTRKLRHHRKLLENYARQWRNEYLQSLRENSNAKVDQIPEITVGDIVIVRNEKTNRNFWKLAKIEELLPGDDGVVRAAVIRTCSNNANRSQLLRRPVKHLIPLEVRSFPSSVVDESDSASKPTTDKQVLPQSGRSRRDAAIAGQLRIRELSGLL